MRLPSAQIEREWKLQAALRFLHDHPSRRMADSEKARAPPAFRLVCVDRIGHIVAATRMGYMIPASAYGSVAPSVNYVKGKRRIHANRRMQRRRLGPCPEAHAGHMLAHPPGGLQWQRHAVDRHHMAVVVEPKHAHFEPFNRRIHITHRTARRPLLAHYVPRLQRAAYRQFNTVCL